MFSQAIFLSYASQDADAAGSGLSKMHCQTLTRVLQMSPIYLTGWEF
jgi:hypothetical protein